MIGAKVTAMQYELCLVVELAWGGSVTNVATPSSNRSVY